MIHRMEFDYKYSSDQIFKDIKDVKVAMVRVYSYICKKYGWEEQIKFLIWGNLLKKLYYNLNDFLRVAYMNIDDSGDWKAQIVRRIPYI